MRFRVGASVVEQFAGSHDFPAVLRELVQNEYDAGGSELEVHFGRESLRIRGNGRPIDAGGWRRLSVIFGTGEVPGTRERVAPKVNGIGSKNFGLRSLFLFGETIHVLSGGRRTVLDCRHGTYPGPQRDPGTVGAPGIGVIVAPTAGALAKRLKEIRHILFAHRILKYYKVLGRRVAVPVRVHQDRDRVLLSGVRRHNEVLALPAEVIALWIPADEHGEWADVVFRLLGSSREEDMIQYLAYRGVAWRPPTQDDGSSAYQSSDDVADAIAEELGPLFVGAGSRADRAEPDSTPETATQMTQPRRPLPALGDVKVIVAPSTGTPIGARQSVGTPLSLLAGVDPWQYGGD